MLAILLWSFIIYDYMRIEKMIEYEKRQADNLNNWQNKLEKPFNN